MKSIKKISLLTVAVSIVLLFNTGCDQDHTPKSSSHLSRFSPSQVTNTPEACAIALSTLDHHNSDKDIIRWQQQARSSERPVPYLEKLGWAFVNRARASLDAGFYILAEQTAFCIDTKKPDSAEAMLLRGHVLHNLHEFKAAEALARSLVAKRGLWFDYGLLGDALMEQGKLAEALQAYQTMMDQRPGPQAYSRAAHLRWLKGDLDGAIEMMRKTAASFGSRHPQETAWAHVRLAYYLLQTGQITQAFGHIDAALAVMPEYAPALLAQGRTLLAAGQSAKAITTLKRAVQLNPSPEYQWTLIEALRAEQHLAEARQIEFQLIDRGALEDARTLALYLATTEQDIPTALRLAKQELRSRRDVFTYDAIAWAFNADGRPLEALNFCNRALAEGTQDARLLFHAGVIAADAGYHQNAVSHLKKALTLQQMLLPSERAQLHKAFAAL
ncbi:MAG: tetratricopeptide repeat protein [Pseudomonadota bacterium]